MSSGGIHESLLTRISQSDAGLGPLKMAALLEQDLSKLTFTEWGN